MKNIGFQKGRKLSNVFYTIAGVILVYRMMFVESASALAFPLLAVSIVFFCVGMVIYSKYCRCPNCGKLQPRYARYHCVDCNSELK